MRKYRVFDVNGEDCGYGLIEDVEEAEMYAERGHSGDHVVEVVENAGVAVEVGGLSAFEEEVLKLLKSLEWAGDGYEGSGFVQCPDCNARVDCITGLEEDEDEEEDEVDLSEEEDADAFGLQVTTKVLRGELIPWQHWGNCRLKDMIEKLEGKEKKAKGEGKR